MRPMPDVSNSEKITAHSGLTNPLYTRKDGWDMSIPVERGSPLRITHYALFLRKVHGLCKEMVQPKPIEPMSSLIYK